mgnify:CR=1 FL=1
MFQGKAPNLDWLHVSLDSMKVWLILSTASAIVGEFHRETVEEWSFKVLQICICIANAGHVEPKTLGHDTIFTRCNFEREIPDILSQNLVCQHWLSYDLWNTLYNALFFLIMLFAGIPLRLRQFSPFLLDAYHYFWYFCREILAYRSSDLTSALCY